VGCSVSGRRIRRRRRRRTGGTNSGHEKKGKTQQKMERGSRKRSSRAGSEKMERVGGG
jgi:hypothetical protein